MSTRRLRGSHYYRLNHAIVGLTNLCLAERTGQRLACHRLVRLAVLKSMDSSTKCNVFTQLVFLLNAAFPSQENGQPLHARWGQCELMASQVSAALESYFAYANELGFPVLLCEVATRCSW